MYRRYLSAIVIGLALLLITTGCSPSKEEMPANTDKEMTEEVMHEEEMTEEAMEEMVEESKEVLKLTLEELAMYNGQDGQPAYVAIEGVIYDVTGIPSWTDGKHNGSMAGNDLTEAIKKAPHGDSKLKGLTVVGEMVE